MFPTPSIDKGKISVRNAWHMLLYAWDLARYQDRWKGAAEAAPHLLGLLSFVLADSVERLLKRQLARSFQPSTGEVRGIKGKIQIGQTLRRQSLLKGKS